MIINKYLYGWDHLEPVLLGCLARGMNILLLGKHGCGKSSISRFFADAFSAETQAKFIRYAMDKENLISMVGIPNVEDLKRGRITYATHERSIFNADVVLFDEITRAPKDSQNMVLEALEEKTIFGMPLKYKFAIATANDESYKATFKLDPALMDRFVVIIPVPTTGAKADRSAFTGAEELSHLIRLNMFSREEDIGNANKELIETIKKIRTTYKELSKNKNIVENIIDYVSKFCAMLLGTLNNLNKDKGMNEIYISPRQIGTHFPKLILSIGAYYKVTEDREDWLENGAMEAYKYSFGTKLGIPIAKLTEIHAQIKDLLTDKDAKIQRIKIMLTTGSLADRIKILKENIKIVKECLEIDETINVVGNMIEGADIETDESVGHLKNLYGIIKENSLNEQCMYKLMLLLSNYITNKGALDKVVQ